MEDILLIRAKNYFSKYKKYKNTRLNFRVKEKKKEVT